MSRYTCHTRIQSVRSFTDNEWTRIARFFLFEGIIHPHVSQRVYLLFPTVWLLCVWRDWARVWADKKYRFGVRWKILLLHLYKGYECNLAHRIWTLTIQKKVSLGNPTTPRINNWSPPKRKTVGSYSALKRSRRSHYIPPWKNGSTRWKKSDSLTFEPSLISLSLTVKALSKQFLASSTWKNKTIEAKKVMDQRTGTKRDCWKTFYTQERRKRDLGTN